MKPLVVDLCCGLGGWSKGFLSQGWDAVGVDLADFSLFYPGRFIQTDLLSWEGWRDLKPVLVVASPPCEEFSRHSMPWTRARKPPQPSLALIERCRFIASQLCVPIILENVRSAQLWLGKSRMNCGPFHLWGDVPALVPVFAGKKKESFGSKQRAQWAQIPLHLAEWFARCFFPSLSKSHNSDRG
jgi:hypothetical protein